MLPGDFRRAVKPEAVEARLKADRSIKAILVAQIDTASGVRQRHRGDRQGACMRPGTTRCCSSTRSPRSAACRSRWMPGAWTSRWPARRRA